MIPYRSLILARDSLRATVEDLEIKVPKYVMFHENYHTILKEYRRSLQDIEIEIDRYRHLKPEDYPNWNLYDLD